MFLPAQHRGHANFCPPNPENSGIETSLQIASNLLKINLGLSSRHKDELQGALPPLVQILMKPALCASLFKFPWLFPWEPPGWRGWDGAGGQAQPGLGKGEGVKGHNLGSGGARCQLLSPHKGWGNHGNNPAREKMGNGKV